MASSNKVDNENDGDYLANSSKKVSWLSRARQHAKATVQRVQTREEPIDMVQRNPNLDLALVSIG